MGEFEVAKNSMFDTALINTVVSKASFHLYFIDVINKQKYNLILAHL